MRIEEMKGVITPFVILDSDIGDPIAVLLRDIAPGKGELIIRVWDRAWSHYWDSMGTGRDLARFLQCAGADYVVGKLIPREILTNNRIRAREEKYLLAIVTAVKEALLLRDPSRLQAAAEVQS